MLEVLTYGRGVRFNGRDAILAIVQDRTEVNAAHREISDTRSLLDSIVDNLPVGVFVKDMEADGLYILFNEACGGIVGRQSLDVVGHSDRIFLRRDQTRRFASRMPVPCPAPAASASKRRCSTYRRPAADLEDRQARLPSPDGGARYLLGISQDVTESAPSSAARLHGHAQHPHQPAEPRRFRRAYQARFRLRHRRQAGGAALSMSITSSISNDSKGHAAGDAALPRWPGLADRSRRRGRSGGASLAATSSRWWWASGSSCIERFAERLLASLSSPFDLDGVSEHMTCSIGIALAPQSRRDDDVLMRHADLALYATPRKAAARPLPLLRAVDAARGGTPAHADGGTARALQKNQFELYYQPIVQLENDRLGGLQALIRWNHRAGLIPPMEFIPSPRRPG